MLIAEGLLIDEVKWGGPPSDLPFLWNRVCQVPFEVDWFTLLSEAGLLIRHAVTFTAHEGFNPSRAERQTLRRTTDSSRF